MCTSQRQTCGCPRVSYHERPGERERPGWWQCRWGHPDSSLYGGYGLNGDSAFEHQADGRGVGATPDFGNPFNRENEILTPGVVQAGFESVALSANQRAIHTRRWNAREETPTRRDRGRAHTSLNVVLGIGGVNLLRAAP